MTGVEFVLNLIAGVVIVYTLSMVIGAKRTARRAGEAADPAASTRRVEVWLNAALVGLLISLLLTAFRPLIVG